MKIVNIKECNLKYKKNEFYSLKNINLEINKGDIVGLIGPNGAGKTTLIKVMAGLLKPTSFNQVNVINKNLYTKENLKSKVGLILNSRQLYNELTIFENIKFFLKLNKIKISKSEIDSLLNQFELLEFKNKLVSKLSTGMKQKVSIIRVFLLKVDLLILDEPTSGLDPVSKSEVHSMLKIINREYKTTILISSHVMDEVNKVCNKVLFINKGEIILDDEIKNAFNKFSKKVINIITKEENSQGLKINLEKLGIKKFRNIKENNTNRFLILEDVEDKNSLIKNIKHESFEERNINLEDIFFYKIYEGDKK